MDIAPFVSLMKRIRIKNLVKPLIRCIMYVCRIFPVKNNKIIFSSFSARSYSDNPKYILEEIRMQRKDYDCVVVLNDPTTETVPEGVRIVKHNTLPYLYEMATAKVWVDNTRKQRHIIKRKNQVYIQTWHGSLALKKIEKDAESSLDPEYIKTAKSDSKKIDYLLTNSSWGENWLRRCFWYDGKILKTGSPRVDILIHADDDLKYRLKKQINLSVSKKYVLYAPTFRNGGCVDAYNINYKRLLNSLMNKFGGEWSVLIRLHPNIRDTKLRCEFNESIINMSKYPDINELYVISDILITDYSSTIFDFSAALKPSFLYASDIKTYQNDRDVLFDLHDLPFPLAEDNDTLEANIASFDYNSYIDCLKRFYSKLGLIEDGRASKRVVKIIDGIVDG